MKAFVLVALAAIAATVASMVFLTATSELSSSVTPQIVLYLTIFSLLIWSPANLFFLWALKEGKVVSEIYAKFSVALAITDALGGIFILSQVPKNTILFTLGLVLGIFVLAWGSKDKPEPVVKSKASETILYILTASILSIGFATSSKLAILVGYIFADVAGGVLSLRLSNLISKRMGQTITYYLSSLLGFAPCALALVLLLLNFRVLPLIGPVSAIGVIAFAGLASVILFDAKVNWKRFSVLAFLGAGAIGMIFYSF
jgi:hypothetical protein